MDNGKKEILKISIQRTASPVAYCALTTKSGTRNEDPRFNGLAHFTEHMFFKGTGKRGPASINNALEKVGGELNAYTTKEETVLHATVLKEDLPKAVDLLAELAFSSVFPQKELEKEREVVLDELVSYKDVPGDCIYEDFEELLFEGHPLQMQILGGKKTLNRIDSSVFREYIAANFHPDNMAFTVVADCPEKKVQEVIGKSVQKYTGKPVEVLMVREGEGRENQVPQTGRFLFGGRVFHKEVARRSHQAHCMVGAEAYSAYSSRRVPLALLTNLLGGPACSARLNMSLRERHGLVYTVEANYTPYADTGIFSIYFGCDKEDVEECLSLVKRELDKVVEEELSPAALKAAKKQLLGQLYIAQDNAEAQCLSMGKSLIVYGRINDFAQMKRMVEEITAAQLKEVAGEILRWDRMSTLIYK